MPRPGPHDRGNRGKVEATGAAYVGITAMTPHIMEAGKIASVIKAVMPDTTLILGGAHVTAVPMETMAALPAFDIAAVGEADNSLPRALLDALKEGRSPCTIPGFMMREDGEVKYTGDRTDKVDIENLPLYAWDLLEGFPDIYRLPLFAAHRSPATPIITSRGCPGKCIFCFSGCHSTISTYSADYILKMVKHLRDVYGIKEFHDFLSMTTS